ncbi:MAG: PEP-CTERM sorting domain-containing protein [Acidobacteriia bacterium]|nr:PEP-CTERM sorting domain-containing protein [Terriglobia bacterium]
MTIIRRVLSAFAPIALGTMFLANTASATPITVTITVYGNLPSFTIGSGGSTSVSQFNQTATNNTIQTNCTFSYICSALTLDSVELGVRSAATINYSLSNTSGSTNYVAGIANVVSPTAAVNAGAAVTFNDGITTALLVADPNITVLTNTNRRNAGCTTGVATRGCLTVTTAGLSINQTATGSDSNAYFDGDAEWASVLAQYVGASTKSFALTSTPATQTGQINFTNSSSFSGTSLAAAGSGDLDDFANITGLVVRYTYTYDETFNPVPEPTSMALMGGALLVVGMVRRRRSNKS